MKLVIQRSKKAEVRVNNKVVGKINKGFMVLVGITHSDTEVDAEYLAKKISGMRIFEDEYEKMNLTLNDVGGDILSISQFTLYADTRKGNRPSFIEAARPEQAEVLYDYFNNLLRNKYELNVETGVFGAIMEVDFINDGPITIIIESPEKK